MGQTTELQTNVKTIRENLQRDLKHNWTEGRSA